MRNLIARCSRTTARGAPTTTRRAFFGDAAAGAWCVFASITNMLTTHRVSKIRQGKPPLTVRSINQYIAAAEREDEPTQLLLAAEVKRDVLAFLDQRFALSMGQRHGLSILTEQDRRRLAMAIERALQPGWRLVFRSSQSNNAASTPAQLPDKTRISVTITGNPDSHHATPNGTVVLSWPCPAS
jgi:hypothetical protein